MQKLVFLTVVLSLISININSQIQSTLQGGPWNQNSTWVGGVIPNTNDDVIINGEVVVTQGSACRDLTVSASEILVGEGWPVTLNVSRHINNFGTIKDLNSSWPLTIEVGGNINNYGEWNNYLVKLIGLTDQTIYSDAEKVFYCMFRVTDTLAVTKVLSPITLTKQFDLNGSTLDLQSNGLRLLASSTTITDGIIVNADEVILGQDAVLRDIIYVGDVSLKGRVIVGSGVFFEGGVVTVEDTLENEGWSWTLSIKGDLVNNGIIRNMEFGHELYINIGGNIVNNGIWTNSKVLLNGINDQNISCGIANVFRCEFEITDTMGIIKALSPVSFSKMVKLNGATLDLQENQLNLFESSTTIVDGVVLNTKDIVVNENAILRNITYKGNSTIHGISTIGSNVFFEGGDITIMDTVQNEGWSAYLHINGNVLNNGMIRSFWGHALSLNIAGNVTSKGYWNVHDNNLLFYSNATTRKLKYFNSGSSNLIVNGCSITGSGANAYSIISGGGNAILAPNDSYEVEVLFNPLSADTIAQLNINCPEMLSFAVFGLIGNKSATTVNVKQEIDQLIPEGFSLSQNYPNPFNPSTRIKYQVSNISQVTLKVYDILGNEIATLVNEEKPAGSYEIEFRPESSIRQLASGIYFYQLKCGNYLETKKMMLIK